MKNKLYIYIYIKILLYFIDDPINDQVLQLLHLHPFITLSPPIFYLHHQSINPEFYYENDSAQLIHQMFIMLALGLVIV